jgi:CRISPR/Cas system-associated exonuclease Cas4 (RecB family)
MKIIKSSEIASYLFCPVSWWLGITKGVKITKAMKKGEKHHVFIAENQSKARYIFICIIITIIVILALLIYRFLA